MKKLLLIRVIEYLKISQKQKDQGCIFTQKQKNININNI